MMIRSAALIALFTLACAAPAAAQEGGWTAPGVTVNDARAWLLENGGQVSVPNGADAATTLRVDDVLPWTLTFYRCQETCADMQYTARFAGPGLTQDWINAWNRDHRFLKASFAPGEGGGEPSAVVQYDVVLTGQGPDQLAQSTAVWKQMQLAFAQTLQRRTRE